MIQPTWIKKNEEGKYVLSRGKEAVEDSNKSAKKAYDTTMKLFNTGSAFAGGMINDDRGGLKQYGSGIESVKNLWKTGDTSGTIGEVLPKKFNIKNPYGAFVVGMAGEVLTPEVTDIAGGDITDVPRIWKKAQDNVSDVSKVVSKSSDTTKLSDFNYHGTNKNALKGIQEKGFINSEYGELGQGIYIGKPEVASSFMGEGANVGDVIKTKIINQNPKVYQSVNDYLIDLNKFYKSEMSSFGGYKGPAPIDLLQDSLKTQNYTGIAVIDKGMQVVFDPKNIVPIKNSGYVIKGGNIVKTPYEKAVEIRDMPKGPETYVYHTTSPEALNKITKDGLKPSSGIYGKGAYFGFTEETTGGYGSATGAMLRVKRGDLPKSYQEFASAASPQGWTTEVVPSSVLEIKVGNTWKPLSGYTVNSKGMVNKATRETLYRGNVVKTESISDYGMSHRPMESNAIASDITKGGEFIPEDFYTHPEWYADLTNPTYQQSLSVLRRIRNNPDAVVTIYRASPSEALNNGDWVTLSKKYAQESAEGVETVHSFKVKAKDIQFAGDDINEFGFFPTNGKSIIPTMEQTLSKLEDEKLYIQKYGKIPPNANLNGFKDSKDFGKFGITEKDQKSAYYDFIFDKINKLKGITK